MAGSDEGPNYLKDVAGFIGGASLIVSGSAAVFTTVYLGALAPVGRLLTWDERIGLALISVSWQAYLLLLIVLTLIVVRLQEERERNAPASGDLVASMLAAIRSGAMVYLILANLVAGALVYFGLDGLHCRTFDLGEFWPIAAATVLCLTGYVVSRMIHRGAFLAPDRLVLAGAVGAVLWLAASGWAKANYDLHRAPPDCVTLSGTALAGPAHNHRVTLLLANSRGVVFVDDGKAIFLERKPDTILKAYRDEAKGACSAGG